jgi:glycosyltransferase involved in cell wall biosynthesis
MRTGILGLTLRGVMLIVDELIVLDHASTDDTVLIIHEIAPEPPGRIHYQCRKDPLWREATIRQSLLDDGCKIGGTHFWVIDADELATGNVLPQIRPLLAALEPGDLITIPWFPLWRSLD